MLWCRTVWLRCTARLAVVTTRWWICCWSEELQSPPRRRTDCRPYTWVSRATTSTVHAFCSIITPLSTTSPSYVISSYHYIIIISYHIVELAKASVIWSTAAPCRSLYFYQHNPHTVSECVCRFFQRLLWRKERKKERNIGLQSSEILPILRGYRVRNNWLSPVCLAMTSAKCKDIWLIEFLNIFVALYHFSGRWLHFIKYQSFCLKVRFLDPSLTRCTTEKICSVKQKHEK